MQFTLTTDYAIRILLYLSTNGKSTSKELSEKLFIPESYTRKILKNDALSKLIDGCAGRNGGYWLRKEGNEISLLDVIRIMEKKIFFHSCLENEKQCLECTTYEEQNCPLRKEYKKVDDKIKVILANVTIEAMAKSSIKET